MNSSVHGHPSPDIRQGGDLREIGLQNEIAALKAENLHLRRQYAQAIRSGTAEALQNSLAELPLPLHPKVHAPDGTSRPITSQMDYESLLAALASVFPIGIFRTDSVGVLTHVDEALQRMFDLQAEDFPNFGWLKRVHPEDLAEVQRSWEAAVRDGTYLSVEFRVVRSDGAIAHILARNAPIHDAQNNMVAQHGFVQDVTSLRELQASSQLKDELNRQIISSSPDCTKVLDLEGHVVQMTEAGCKLIEIDEFESVRGGLWSDWWKGGHRTVAIEALAKAGSGEGARFVGFCETFKGTAKWWDTVVTPIRDSRGQVAMLLAVSRDITDFYTQQQQIQLLNDNLEGRVTLRTQELASVNEQLQQSLTNAKRLYNEAPCGYHSVDAQGTIITVNQTALDWFGHTEEQVVGQTNFRDFVHPDHLDTVEERFQRLKRHETVESTEVCARRSDGGEIWLLVSSAAAFDTDGQFLHTHSSLVDITERHAAEVALAAQRSFLQTISNSVPAQIAFFDRDLICRFSNASYARWKGGNPKHLLGLHLRDIARPENFEQGQAYLQAALQGVSQRFEGDRTFPDGQPFYAHIEYVPYVEAGRVKGLIIQMHDISDRRAAEMQVAQSNEKLSTALSSAQSLYDNAPCGYHSLDQHKKYLKINDTELKWIGYERDEVIGKLGFESLISQDQQPLLNARKQAVIEGALLENAEYEIQRRDGSTFPALLSTSAVYDANGVFLHTNTTMVNIAERKAAELALQESQRFLRAITEQVPGILGYVDAAMRVRFANAEHLEFYGIDPKNMIGLLASECFPARMWVDIERSMKAALSGERQQYEAWRTKPNGERFCISANYVPDIDEGLIKGVFIQIFDITERKRVEDSINHLNDELESRIKERSNELLESEQRFRLMVDNLREYSIFFFDTEGFITDWTDSAQRLEGYSPTETMGRHYSMLFSRKSASEARSIGDSMMQTAVSRGQNELHGWYQRKDGTSYWAHSVIIALRDDQGELRGFAKINRDMSDAKRLDDLMRNIHEELENRVADRTDQLLAANKDLESFSYSVSHDLRSPLRHISSFVSLLDEHLGPNKDEDTARFLGTIASSARNMSSLIDGLLEFSKLGRQSVNLIEVDFSEQVKNIISTLSHETQGRSIDWVISPDLPMVYGDPVLLREVWSNLLGNALKYSRPRECARIEVSWGVDPALGYTFAVADNGVGFNPLYSDKLFGVFQRLHRASEFEGTGIGLALTRRILERHGGSIWAESSVGEGSTFSFSMPFEGASPLAHALDSKPSLLEP